MVWDRGVEVGFSFVFRCKMEELMSGHVICDVAKDSIAEEMGITPGDILLSINGETLEDIFDYHYLVNDEEIVVLIQKPDGEQWELEIEKNYEEDLGLEFDQALLDEYHSCRNKCIFCFIDQMPPGMRETLYFKDDDARLSFLQGNYITLTNMSDKDVDRIIRFHLAPINISIHTMNPKLRCRMLNNRFAGDALKKMQRFYEAGIEMNSQVVLCKGWNDGEELTYTIRELAKMYPVMESLSVVPIGLTKYREGLEKMEPFDKEESKKVLSQIHSLQEELLEKLGTRFVHASDEWYVMAEEEIPDADYYEGYGQLENGVGMIRSFVDECEAYLQTVKGDGRKKEVSMVTGRLVASYMIRMVEKIREKYPDITVHVYPIRNDFFGELITVAGLITGQDIIAQLKDRALGDYLILPGVLLRSGEEVLLDDVTVTDIAETLQTKICVVQSDGESFVRAIVDDFEI